MGPAALRFVRSRPVSWASLWRIWHAWSSATPPAEFRWLLALVGDGGSLVQIGDPGGYRDHGLTCWKREAERVTVEYALRVDGPVPGA